MIQSIHLFIKLEKIVSCVINLTVINSLEAFKLTGINTQPSVLALPLDITVIHLKKIILSSININQKRILYIIVI